MSDQMSDETSERVYRQCVRSHLRSSRVTVQETDLIIYAPQSMAVAAKEAVIQQRGYLEHYLCRHPDFLAALDPLPLDPLSPQIVQEMLLAGKRACVGPMAAVAGAMAEQVGLALLEDIDEVIIENGGDVFLKTQRKLTVGLYAGRSPLSMKVGLKIAPVCHPLGVCTSSGTVGHSLSLGKADAVCVVSTSCALADAAATSIGNRVQSAGDIENAMAWGRGIPGVDGIVVIVGDRIGGWGAVKLASLS
jgi:ApbE superfamily uncharacterized protein (UPF0280 family)